jgi:transcriptional regulator with XRE-family HTH domain
MSRYIIKYMNENEFRKKIGLNIKSLRVKRELHQSDLADFAQLNINSIGSIERGEQNFTISSLWAIAEVLKVEPKDLLDV